MLPSNLPLRQARVKNVSPPIWKVWRKGQDTRIGTSLLRAIVSVCFCPVNEKASSPWLPVLPRITFAGCISRCTI